MSSGLFVTCFHGNRMAMEIGTLIYYSVLHCRLLRLRGVCKFYSFKIIAYIKFSAYIKKFVFPFESGSILEKDKKNC